MSKVKIQGNASGTGVVTLTAPNTNTDRTITLPDGDITLGGGVDGIVSTANATAITIGSDESTTFSQKTIAGKTAGNYGAVSEFKAQGSGIKLRVDDFSNASATTRMFITHNWNRDSGTGTSDNSGVGLSALKFDDGSVTISTSASGTSDPTERLKITSDGRGLSQFTAKAWVKYDQINNTVDDSHNVSSVTDTAAGRYQVFFSTSMANTTYTAFVCINDRGSFGDDNFVTDTETTGSFFVRTKHQNAAGTAYAQDFVSSAIVFGD